MHVHVSKTFCINRCGAQIEELKTHVTSLDNELAQERERAEELAKDLAMAKQIAAALDSELINVHLPYDSQIKALRAQMNHLDTDLADQLQQGEAMAKQLADEKLKSAVRELKMQTTISDLERCQQELTENEQVRMCQGAKGVRCEQRDFLGRRAKCD